jgi:hypothetical protein
MENSRSSMIICAVGDKSTPDIRGSGVSKARGNWLATDETPHRIRGASGMESQDPKSVLRKEQVQIVVGSLCHVCKNHLD